MHNIKVLTKPIFGGLVITLLSITLLSSCFRIFDEITWIYYDLYNESSSEILVEYSTIETEDTDSIVVLTQTRSNIFIFELEGLVDKPSDEEFSNYLRYFKIFENDTLVYSQNPTDKKQWTLVRDSFDDEMNFYYYVFYVTDSLITYDQSP